ncbi:MAG: tyrosine--tRNA ligase, partial [Patescibacteria group bacterium]
IGVAETITETDLHKLLKSKKTLNVKLGVDPTSKDLHLGHAVVLGMLKQFQDLGHKAYLVIGDFTASIGDPAGANKTRPALAESEIRENMQTYLDQAKLILDMEKTEVVYNSSWLKDMTLGQFTGYATEVSVNSLIEREDFANRLKANQSLSLHELLYPVVQALDSVELKTDIEIGGWDQRLNLLTARELQKKLGQKPEVLIMMKGLIGTDGVKKMSKSHNNYIALTETAGQMFGKIMSLKDELIPNYAEMAAGFDEYQVNRLSTLHPKEAKIEVATAIVETYHGKEAAEQARDIFEDTFSSRRVSSTLVEEIDFADFDLPLIQIVTKATASSSSEARRLIEQGGVRINGETVKDQFKKVNLRNKSVQMQIGRHRFFSLLWKKDD